MRSVTIRKLQTFLIAAAFVFSSPGRASEALAGNRAATNSGNPAAKTLANFILPNVCVNAQGGIIADNPLHCPSKMQRDIAAGDVYNYYHSDYAPVTDKQPCAQSGGLSRRYVYVFPFKGRDQTGSSIPVYGSWTDFPANSRAKTPDECGWGAFDAGDSVNLLAIEGGYSTILAGVKAGATRSQDTFALTLGTGYLDPATAGVGRFNATWPYSTSLPAMNTAKYFLATKKSLSIGHLADALTTLASFPAHNPNLVMAASAVAFNERLMMTYGTNAHPVGPLDTLLLFGFVFGNDTADGPAERATGTEHLYLTDELGYVTRWESWTRWDTAGYPNEKLMARARLAVHNQNCTGPKDVAGPISPHLTLGPIVFEGGAYSQQYDSILSDGTEVSHRWYMTGCHDYTNVNSLVQPLNPGEFLGTDLFPPEMLNLFK